MVRELINILKRNSWSFEAIDFLVFIFVCVFLYYYLWKRKLPNKKTDQTLFDIYKDERGKAGQYPFIYFYEAAVSKILLGAAFFLLAYEIVLFAKHIIEGGWEYIEAKNIFNLLIISTAAVAFVGLHFVVDFLIKLHMNHSSIIDTKRVRYSFVVVFALIITAIVLGGLIVAYERQYLH